MKKQIIESNTEPNKNCLWLTPSGLKRYGKSGWENLTNGSGNGGEDKVFEIKIKHVRDDETHTHNEFMINGVGWFRAYITDDFGWQIGYLNGERIEDWRFVREIFKDIETYNKLKLTDVIPLDDVTEIPISTTEELTYYLGELNGMFGVQLYSKVYVNIKNKFFLMASVDSDNNGGMTFS